MDEDFDVLMLGQRGHDFEPPIVVGHAKRAIAHLAQEFFVEVPAYVFEEKMLDIVQRGRLLLLRRWGCQTGHWCS